MAKYGIKRRLPYFRKHYFRVMSRLSRARKPERIKNKGRLKEFKKSLKYVEWSLCPYTIKKILNARSWSRKGKRFIQISGINVQSNLNKNNKLKVMSLYLLIFPDGIYDINHALRFFIVPGRR